MAVSWHMKIGDDKRIHLMRGDEKMKAEGNYKDGKRSYIGPVSDVRHHTKTDRAYLLVRINKSSSELSYVSTFLQFQTVKDTIRPKPLIADHFNSSANDFCQLFERAGSASNFVHIWKTKVRPHLTSDGHFYDDAGIGKALQIACR